MNIAFFMSRQDESNDTKIIQFEQCFGGIETKTLIHGCLYAHKDRILNFVMFYQSLQ